MFCCRKGFLLQPRRPMYRCKYWARPVWPNCAMLLLANWILRKIYMWYVIFIVEAVRKVYELIFLDGNQHTRHIDFRCIPSIFQINLLFVYHVMILKWINFRKILSIRALCIVQYSREFVMISCFFKCFWITFTIIIFFNYIQYTVSFAFTQPFGYMTHELNTCIRLNSQKLLSDIIFELT